MSEIMPPAPEDNTQPAPASLRGVAHLMAASADPFTQAASGLVDRIAYLHEPPVACDYCQQYGGPCGEFDDALTTAFAWLLKVVEERG